MRSAKHLLAILISLLLCAPAIPAQDAQQPQRLSKATSDVTIIIEQEQVRFAAQGAVAEMRLQIFDQVGELVYDSGALLAPEINWPLQNGNGQALKSGLYAYALSLKEAGKESGKDTTRVRRGHFIVDRAKERDGADKLWVTSQNDSGIGAALTVAKDETATVAGAVINGERTLGQRAEVSKREDASRRVEAETQTQAKAGKTEVAAAAAGTIGRIAKFISATEVGDSLISESGGGVQLPAFVSLATTPQGNNISFGTPNTETGMTISGAAGRADVRFDGTTLRLLAGPAGGPPSNGIGITSNNVQLPNNVSLAVGAQGNGVSFGSPNSETGMTISGAGGRADLRFDGTLKLLNGPGGIPPVTNGIAITTAGNVGIGTATPAAKLHVQSSGFAELAIRSTNERAILALTNTLSAGAYTWTMESGVRGLPGVFGIYNRVVNRSGLEIDGNLLVYVKALQITGGADFAENFDVRAPDHRTGKNTIEIQPGMVVAIDPSAPGKLSVSRRAYDRRVAGIISGAGNVKPGMMMRQEGTLADGQHPVALSGRVYVWVDATRGSIRPGDLLTTSATAGHAMRVSNSAKAQGAIIGKAMTGLKSGKGLVLVLVTLQ